jgi:hypothetical protein
VRDYLSGVNDPAVREWGILCSQAKLDDPEVRRYGIRGFPWHSTIKWA